ncbi:glycosyltransferase [Herbivorax sp. ANBcel31]|uniref:glycosyltransferase family 2 protein n=1 Tax=Herbivorax sp. ANBcel31 TaxID=3069754 RepID=UPI0027B6BDA4|nr:glycosyltransferase [Herbivorax sp. ANBcel31]MDQ2085437.1 glycosyltransferase [Herbivorax sp. ANBcel31]
MIECSIIIPYYQRYDLLINCLNSFLNQTKKEDLEIIIVDDGSDIVRDKELEKYKKELNISYEYMHRDSTSGSPSRVRNKGFSLSKGRYIVFLDCDMIVPKDFVQQVIGFFEENSDISHILQIGFRNNLKASCNTAKLEEIKHQHYSVDIREKVLNYYKCNMQDLKTKWLLAWSHTMCMKRDTINKFGCFDEEFSGWGLEDTELAYRYDKQGGRILHNPKITAFHQWHKSSYLAKYTGDWRKNYEKFLKKYNNKEVKKLGELSYCLNEKEIVQSGISAMFLMVMYEEVVKVLHEENLV